MVVGGLVVVVVGGLVVVVVGGLVVVVVGGLVVVVVEAVPVVSASAVVATVSRSAISCSSSAIRSESPPQAVSSTIRASMTNRRHFTPTDLQFVAFTQATLVDPRQGRRSHAGSESRGLGLQHHRCHSVIC